MAKILAIDDDSEIGDLMKDILENEGHQVTCISDGIFAMKAIQDFKPDLIICDILMPQLDGHALVYHLKFEAKIKVPVMILTSLGEEKSYLGKEVAADYYMAKPFEREELVEVVERLLSSEQVKFGVRKSHDESESRGLARKKTLALIIMVLFAVLVVASFLLARNQTHLIGSFEIKPDISDSQYMSILSDRLFIYASPIALGVLLYQAYIMRKLASKK